MTIQAAGNVQQITVIVCSFFVLITFLLIHAGDQQSNFYTCPTDKGSVQLTDFLKELCMYA